MSRKQGPRMAGMRPTAIADGRRHSRSQANQLSKKEAGA